MAELVLTNVDNAVLHHLQERAMRHGRTPTEEAEVILADALREKSAADWTEVDAIFNRLAVPGRTYSDSADLLREDRER